MRRRNCNLAFTLVELIVCMAVIVLLIGIILPAVQYSRESARKTHCSNNIRQLAIAFQNLESAKRKLPSGITSSLSKPFSRMTWHMNLLNYIEQKPVWEQAMEDYAVWPDPAAHNGLRSLVPSFACPSSPLTNSLQITRGGIRVACTDYLGVIGADDLVRNGVMYLDSSTRFQDITDGLSNTLLIGERSPSPDAWFGWWYTGYGQGGSGSVDMLLGVREINQFNNPALRNCSRGPYSFVEAKPEDICDSLHYWSFHFGGSHFSFCDGSVRFLSYDSDGVLSALSTRSQGEVVPDR